MPPQTTLHAQDPCHQSPASRIADLIVDAEQLAQHHKRHANTLANHDAENRISTLKDAYAAVIGMPLGAPGSYESLNEALVHARAKQAARTALSKMRTPIFTTS